jgi:NAD(P)-dependent dehydrogenase (short-subunit alcohol dehydrogenase family)
MKIAIIGASGTIGKAFVKNFLQNKKLQELYLFSRIDTDFEDYRIIHSFIDIEDEESIKKAATIFSKETMLDAIIVTTGILHTQNILPEKSLKDLSQDKFFKLYAVNTIGPALIAKYFISKLNYNSKSIFAVLSARVGSISDNYLGGWYSYKCSKAALNMLIKNISIEIRRKNPYPIIVGLHPGTVNSQLSSRFTSNVSQDKVFTADYAVTKMIGLLLNLTKEDTGKLFAWDGKKIEF